MPTNHIEKISENIDNEIHDLNATEIDLISGGLLHIRKLPQITNSPDV
jgi:hypothetical protein